MSNFTDNFDPEKTIPNVTLDGGEIADYSKLREEFRIFPDADGSRYYDLKLLGMGGMGVVFSGSDPTLERVVAVKILREPYRRNREQIAKFINEARITARIDHPNIVAVHQLGVNEHHGVYFSMRRISGETLQTVLRKLRENDPDTRKKYTLERMLDIFIAGCNAVAAAHEKQILHCDLKPANIMIGAFGEVLVLDWGLAREFNTVSENKNSISGTPAYMAPELVTGENPVPDIHSDVYALGTILFSILTLHPAPFDMDMEKTLLLEKVASGKSFPLRAPKGSTIPRELAAICRKAMALDRNERYSSVTALLNDIYNYRSRYPVQAYSPNIFYRFFKLCRRHPAIPAAVIVAGVTMLLYVMSEKVFEFTHDRSLMRSAMINSNIADSYYHRTLFMYRNGAAKDNIDNPLQLVISEKDLQLQANAALMEYFSILDSVSGISPAGLKQFASGHATQIFRHILELAVISGNRKKLAEIMDRCRRYESFATACRQDSRLNELVRQIENGSGTVVLNFPDAVPRQITLTMPDKSLRQMEVSGKMILNLQSGFYQVKTADHVVMHWHVLPGSRSEFAPGKNKNDGFYVIPDDHCELTLPRSGNVRLSLTEFAIAAKPLDGLHTHDEAQKIIAGNPAIRLPGAVELLKAWSKKDGQPFYLPSTPDSGKVWLNNGMIFDIESRYSEKPQPGQKALIFPVRVSGEEE